MPKNPNVTIRVPNRSAFDWSHHNLLSQKCGTIVPIFSNEVIPGTKINQKIAISVTMPPLVSDTYMRVSYKVAAFFCPYRILFGGFEDYFTQYAGPVVTPGSGTDPNTISDTASYCPYLSVTLGSAAANVSTFAPGTLSDYLGFRGAAWTGAGNSFKINIFPFMAYHMIWAHYYRANQVQKFPFARPAHRANFTNSSTKYSAAMLPYEKQGYGLVARPGNTIDDTLLADGVSILHLRQANFGFDYFTNAFPTATEAAQTAGVTVSGSTGTLSIATLRAANSLQQFSERMQLAGYEFSAAISSRYGASLSKGVASRPVLLGTADYEVYSHGVNVQTPTSESSNNPFISAAGARVGNAFGSGSDFLIRGFECNEPGIIMVMGVLMPRVTYGTGMRRYMSRYTSATVGSITDWANPLLQNTGNDPIYKYELHSSTYGSASPLQVFGYTDKYASWMNMEDELHSLFVTGQPLEYFALQRAFGSAPTINSAFLEVPTTYFDGVTAADSSTGGFACWADIDFDCKVLMPLYPYSMPSLQDPAYEHGKPVTIRRGGFRF